MSAANGLQVMSIPDKELQLGQLESNLIAKTIIFQKIYQLPKSRMAACKDRLINIPVSSEDVINTIEHLPRTQKEAGLLEVKLKRKLEYKNTHQQALIDPERIFKALQFLKNSGHPDYQFYDNVDNYKIRCKQTETIKTKFVHDVDVKAMLDKEEYLKTLKQIPYLTDEEDSDSEDESTDAEDEEYIKKDVVRKFQFDYDTSVCLVDKFPEAAITEESTNIESKEISIAPGEGKIPENILNSNNWDIKAFPMKHPDGNYNLHQDRQKKLTDQYYFVQRMRNKDQRFSTDPSYIWKRNSFKETQCFISTRKGS